MTRFEPSRRGGVGCVVGEACCAVGEGAESRFAGGDR